MQKRKCKTQGGRLTPQVTLAALATLQALIRLATSVLEYLTK
jgi:hypothetical protein